MVHTPSPILDADFEAGHLKTLSYSLQEISAAIVRNVSRKPEDFTPRQKTAIERFKYAGHINLGSAYNAWKEPARLLEDMKTFFAIFDDVYFGGLLKGNYTMEVLSRYDAHRRYQRDIFCGMCVPQYPEGRDERDPQYKREKVNVHILLVHQDYVQEKYSLSYNGNLTSKLWFMKCSMPCFLFTHAALFWQRAAYAIEKADTFPGALFGLEQSFHRALNLAANGANRLNEAEMEELGRDRAKNVEKENELEDAKIERNKTRKVRTMPWKTSSCLRNQCTVDGWEESFGYDHQGLIKFSHLAQPEKEDQLISTLYYNWWNLFSFKKQLVLVVPKEINKLWHPIIHKIRHFEG